MILCGCSEPKEVAMVSLGEAQEARAREYVRRLGCGDVIAGEGNIKRLLNLKVIAGADSNCADIVGFRPSLENAIGAVVL
jgi:hypothetical protein